MKENHVKYFENEKNNKNSIFFLRFSNIEFKGKKILDLGCGHGAISIDLAQKGAKEVVGVDINKERLNFANENLKKNFPDLEDKITFKSIDFRTLEDNDFDLIVSKASFEHIIGLDSMLHEMKNKLKVGGKIISGFCSLYNSPLGDHNRLFKYKIPWIHLILSNKYLIKNYNKHNAKKINNIHDLGLNGYSFKDYKNAFSNIDGLNINSLRTNVSDKKSMKIFNLFTYIPFLKEYFTYSIYCVLERTK